MLFYIGTHTYIGARMFRTEMIPILKKAFSIKILNISTYKGYDGADILKFTFTEVDSLIIIRDFCKSISIKTNSKQHNRTYELYCIFEYSDDIYHLKD